MTHPVGRAAVVVLAACLTQLPAISAAQIAVGQTNNFEDGTTQGWIINLLGMGAPPAAAIPANVATGGPAGAGDNYLRLNAVGGNGGASKLSVLNPGGWNGNYLAAGVGSIRMNAINLGATSLFLRFLVEDPAMGPPTNIAMSAVPVVLAAGSGWQTVEFPLFGAGGLTALMGSVAAALGNTTTVRILHSPTFTFGPGAPAESVVGSLGVDNITAVAVVPEPSTVALFATGALGLLGIARRRRSPR